MRPKSVKMLFQVLELQWKESLLTSSAHLFQASLLLFILVPVFSSRLNGSFLSSVFAASCFYRDQSEPSLRSFFKTK